MKKPGKTELTAVERRVVSGWKAAGLPCENITPENVRRMIRRHAYHEAGTLPPACSPDRKRAILLVSIIPEGDLDGRERSAPHPGPVRDGAT
jgi:hypothetical protein